MDSSGKHCTVSLIRCDEILRIPSLSTNIINNVNIVFIDPKDSGVSSKTTELKRSARLSKKRTLKDDSVAEISDRLDDSNKAKKLCNTLKSNKTKSKISVTPKNDNKTYNNQDSVMSITKVSSEFSNVSNVQPSLNTIVDEGEKTPVKSLPQALKNKISSDPPIVTNVKYMSTMYNVNTSEHKNSDDLVKLARKRGRPPQKELQLLLRDSTVKVNRCYKDEVERQKTGKGFLEPVEKSLDVYESDSTIIQDDANHTSTPERNNHDCEPSKSKRKRIKIKSSTFNVENVANDSCLSVGSTGSVKSVSTTTSEHAEVLPDDANKPKLSRDETFDCEIALISNRFNVPCDTLRNIIERESVPVFREKYSDTVTMSMVTV